MSGHPADCVCGGCYDCARGVFPGWWPQDDRTYDDFAYMEDKRLEGHDA